VTNGAGLARRSEGDVDAPLVRVGRMTVKSRDAECARLRGSRGEPRPEPTECLNLPLELRSRAPRSRAPLRIRGRLRLGNRQAEKEPLANSAGERAGRLNDVAVLADLRGGVGPSQESGTTSDQHERA